MLILHNVFVEPVCFFFPKTRFLSLMQVTAGFSDEVVADGYKADAPGDTTSSTKKQGAASEDHMAWYQGRQPSDFLEKTDKVKHRGGYRIMTFPGISPPALGKRKRPKSPI